MRDAAFEAWWVERIKAIRWKGGRAVLPSAEMFAREAWTAAYTAGREAGITAFIRAYRRAEKEMLER